jgi:type VI secretion system secreted protein VgrG
MSYTQTNRLLRATSILGNNQLLPLKISGKEGLSMPFSYSVDCLITHAPTNLDKLLTTPLCVNIQYNNDKPCPIHGLITKINKLSSELHYRIKINPWISLLKLNQNCRIFQNKSIPDIAGLLFKEHGFNDFTFNQLKSNYPPLNYVVQYNESDFHFVSRLLEKAGIYYYFEHQMTRHIIHFIDSNISCPLIAAAILDLDKTKTEPHIYNWSLSHKMGMPETINATSNIKLLQAGRRFTLENNKSSRPFLITYCQLEATDSTYLTQDQPQSQSFHNKLTAIDATQQFSPKQLFNQPTINGLQTATVVGPHGQELYLDEQGRVKVQFHWDRLGKYNEHSSCWLRVIQAQAGNNWGMFFIPRIGHEVLVGFQNGDINHPIITGSAYNQTHKPAYNLPAEQLSSGFKTRSTPNGTGGNELTFIDKSGSEQIYLKAQKDFVQSINNNATLTVKNNHTTTIKQGNHQINVEQGSSSITAAKHIQLKVKSSSITLKPDGITLCSKSININPSSH